MARKQATRELRTPIPVGIGAGITEKFYLQHLRDQKGYKLKLLPRFFGSDNAYDMDKLVSNVLAGGAKVICVYDKDVTQWNEEQKRRLTEFEQKYAGAEGVVLCPSMPSIEYWFLLHFEDYTGLIKSCGKKLQKLLSPYMAPYFPLADKKLINLLKDKKYIEKSDWVENLCSDGKLDAAIKRAEDNIKAAEEAGDLANQSYSYVYKAFKER